MRDKAADAGVGRRFLGGAGADKDINGDQRRVRLLLADDPQAVGQSRA